MKVTFKDFEELGKVEFFIDTYNIKRHVISEIKKFIDIEKIKIFYYRYLSDNKNLEILIITDKNINILRTDESSNNILIKTIGREKIKELNIKTNITGKENVELEINMDNDIRIILNSKEDINNDFNENLNEKIIDIFKELA